MAGIQAGSIGPSDDDRRRLARSISEFWYGGSGPTHEEIIRVFDVLDLNEAIEGGSKRDRGHSAVTVVPVEALGPLVANLVELLVEGRDLVVEDPPESRQSSGLTPIPTIGFG